MFERTIIDSEFVTMKQVCRELKIAPNTIHSLHRRFKLLPKPIVANKHTGDPKDPFKRKIRGREVFYSRRLVGFFEKIRNMHDEGIPYNEIAKRKDILDEKRLIELLHETSLIKDPLKKDDDFYRNFDILINMFAKKIGWEDFAYYAQLSKDARVAFKEYEAANREIGNRAYAANFKVEDLMKKKQDIAVRLTLFIDMVKTVLRKIGDVAAEDRKFKEEVVRIIRKG